MVENITIYSEMAGGGGRCWWAREWIPATVTPRKGALLFAVVLLGHQSFYVTLKVEIQIKLEQEQFRESHLTTDSSVA